jgi:hypothetical protein
MEQVINDTTSDYEKVVELVTQLDELISSMLRDEWPNQFDKNGVCNRTPYYDHLANARVALLDAFSA